MAGVCYTFIDPGDEARLPELQKVLGLKIALEDVPDAVLVPHTPLLEKGEYDRIRDEIRQKADPTYQGAFHQKQREIAKPRARVAAKASIPKGTPAKKGGKNPQNNRKKKSR
jgi:ATP-dependent RNA helicase RhlE